MPDSSSTVELKLKWVLDGGRLRPLEQSADAIRSMTRAEEELARATARATDALTRQGQAARAAAPSRADIAAELVRSGVSYGRRTDPRQAAARAEALAAARSGRSLHEQRLADLAARRQDAGQFETFMARHGLTPGGDPLPADRGLVGRELEAVGGRMGLPPGAAARLGPYSLLAAPVVAGKMALDEAVQARQTDATPFLAPYQAREQELRNLPLGVGRLYGKYEDSRAALSGDLDARRASAEYRVKEPARAGLLGESRSADDAYDAERGILETQAEVYAGLQLDRRSSTDRESVAGQRRYEEETRLLPARQKLTLATKERAAAEKSVADAMATQAAREKELDAARDTYDQAEARRRKAAGRPIDPDDHRIGRAVLRFGAGVALGGVSGVVGTAAAAEYAGSGTTEYMKADAEREKSHEDFVKAQRLADEARQRISQRRADLIGARTGERTVKYGVTQAEYANAVRREGEARQGGRNLAGLGFAGRETVKSLALMARAFGLEALAPEHLSLLEQAAPETVGKWKERAGEKYKPELRALFPDEPRYQPTGKATKRMNELEERGIRQQQDLIIREAQETPAKLDELRRLLNDQFRNINVRVELINSDMMAANINRK